MKKRLVGIVLGLALVSSAAYGLNEDGTKELVKKYKRVKTYAIELRTDNMKMSNELRELKELLLEDYNKEIETLNAEGKMKESDLTINDKTALEIYIATKDLSREEKMEEVMEEEVPVEKMMEEEKIESEIVEEAKIENEAPEMMEEKAE